MGVSGDRVSGTGGIVRACRMRAGLTQEQLAELSGLSVRTISDIERGTTTRPRQSTIALLEAALEVAPAPGADTLTSAGLAGGFDPSLPVVVPRQLPPGPRGFVGREAELKALTGLLDRESSESSESNDKSALVITALAGTAGVGKTALAVRWAHAVATEFPDGQLFVNLRGYDPDQPVTAGDALAGFLGALGRAEPGYPGARR